MGELVEVRVYPKVKDGDAEVALMRFPEGFGGGGEESKAFGGWSDEINISNSGMDVVVDMGSGLIELDQGDVLNDAPAGAYLVKLHATWGAGTNVGSGAAQLVLFHIADDDTESVLGVLLMSPEYPNLGDMVLSDVHPTGEKIDVGVAPAAGRLELRAMQSTAQGNMTLTTRVVIAKL